MDRFIVLHKHGVRALALHEYGKELGFQRQPIYALVDLRNIECQDIWITAVVKFVHAVTVHTGPKVIQHFTVDDVLGF